MTTTFAPLQATGKERAGSLVTGLSTKTNILFNT
jgi:hypothetical protein